MRKIPKRCNTTIRNNTTSWDIDIYIHITNKFFDRNKKVIGGSHTTDRLVIQQKSRVFVSKV